MSEQELEQAETYEPDIPPRPICTTPSYIYCLSTSEGEIIHQPWSDDDVELQESLFYQDGGDSNTDANPDYVDVDEIGPYIELCFADHMSKVILEEDQYDDIYEGQVATLRVYVTAAAKRAVVVKEDDLLTKKEIAYHIKNTMRVVFNSDLILQ